MNADQLFSISNSIALLSWIYLIIFPYKKWTSRILTGVVITLLGILYAWTISGTMSPGDFESFNSLKGIMKLFSNEKAVLAGWIHYLAFDLMVGLYIVHNAGRLGINRWLIIPCLLFTFMLGPFGLLLYFALRAIITKKYFHSFES